MGLKLVILLVLFAFKHFLGDWVFQRNGISGMKRLAGWSGVKAVLRHASIHGMLTYIIVAEYLSFKLTGNEEDFIFKIFIVGFTGILFGFIDFVSHFIIDFIKIRIEKNLRLQWLWSDFGIRKLSYKIMLLILDQTAHSIVYCYFIWKILAGVG